MTSAEKDYRDEINKAIDDGYSHGICDDRCIVISYMQHSGNLHNA